MREPAAASFLSTVTALPWCCIAPAALSMAGAATAGLGAAVAKATPLFLVTSAGFLGRALYLALVRRSGKPWARAITLAVTPLVVALWAYRLGLWHA